MTRSAIFRLLVLFFAAVTSYAWDVTTSPYTFSGQVGIGTESPETKFHVNGNFLVSGNSWPKIDLKATTAGQHGQLRLMNSAGDYWGILNHAGGGDFFKILWNGNLRLWLDTDGNLAATSAITSGTGYFNFGGMQRIWGNQDKTFVFRSNNPYIANIYLKNSSDQFVGGINGNAVSGITNILDANYNPAISIDANDSAVTITRIPPQGDVLMGDFTE